jgi:ABC-type transporter lipoprotein component MlaA
MKRSCAQALLLIGLAGGLVGCAGKEVPDTAQTGLRNFFSNLRFPINFVNNLLQLKPLDAGEDLSRFLVNMTVGVLGFVDVASTPPGATRPRWPWTPLRSP